MSNFKTAKIIFFSGTGGTARVANQFKSSLEVHGYKVSISEIQKDTEHVSVDVNLLILVFAVHAFNAPKSVYEWIKKCSTKINTPAAVISVSGGGEMICNTACRVRTVKLLRKKGFTVTYENMVVMPCNVLIKTPEPVAVKLLEVLPSKINDMVKDIISGKMRKSNVFLIDRFISLSGELEKYFANWFGKHIKPLNNCNGCGLCSVNCPVQNIEMSNGLPKYNNKCQLCMRCIYDCPNKALTTRYFKSFILKDGFNLNELEKKHPLDKSIDVGKEIKGFIWSGVRKYLDM